MEELVNHVQTDIVAILLDLFYSHIRENDMHSCAFRQQDHQQWNMILSNFKKIVTFCIFSSLTHY